MDFHVEECNIEGSGPGGDKRAASVDRLKVVACDGKAVLGV